MHLPDFQKILARDFYPLLRAEGFRGSGATLRRINEPVVHVFNLQGSSNGARCYLNLGAHLSFLPTEADSVVSAKSLLEPHCIWRTRIDPPDGQPGWSYGFLPDDTTRQVERIAAEWQTQARPFFNRYTDYSAGILAIVTDALTGKCRSYEALHYARIARHLKQPDLAAKLLERGLADCPVQAKSLRAELEQLLRNSRIT